jgi:sigma-54-interacting transcriptional regulator
MKAPGAHQAEWTVLRTAPVNALLVGSPHLTGAAVARVERNVRQPVVWWAPAQTTDVPELPTGTLVIRDVDHLDARQQQRLTDWIGTHSPVVQILGLTREPLFTRVEDGHFSAALYYRMNTVVVEVRAPADLP